MKTKIFKICLSLLVFLLLPNFAKATNYFNWDCETMSTSNGTGTGFRDAGGGLGSTSLSTTTSHGGTKSEKFVVVGSDGNNQPLGIDGLYDIAYGWNMIGSRAMYYRWWMRIDTGFSWGNSTAKTKASRVMTGASPAYTGYLMHNGFVIGECDSYGCTSNLSNVTSSDDDTIKIPFTFSSVADSRWHEYVVKVKSNTSAACIGGTNCDAQFQVWVDGVSVGEYNNFKLHGNASTSMLESTWNGWMEAPYFQLGGSASDGGTIYVDDFSTDDAFNSIYSGGSDTAAPAAPSGLSVM